MLVCEASPADLCFYERTYRSQAVVLISVECLRKEKVLIAPSSPHIALVLLVIILKEFFLLVSGPRSHNILQIFLGLLHNLAFFFLAVFP